MKKIQQIQQNGFYIFCGKSNSNSCFIEKISHAKKFLIYANSFLKNHIKIYDYVIDKDGWTLVVRIQNIEAKPEDIWKIVSEKMRLFLSTFVRVTNRDKGRTGCLVHSIYERFYFQSLREALTVIEKIRNQQIKHYNKRKKYRGLKIHYKISKIVGKGSIFLCSKELRKEKSKVLKKLEVLDFKGLHNLVVEEFIKSTIIVHQNQNSSHYP